MCSRRRECVICYIEKQQQNNKRDRKNTAVLNEEEEEKNHNELCVFLNHHRYRYLFQNTEGHKLSYTHTPNILPTLYERTAVWMCKHMWNSTKNSNLLIEIKWNITFKLIDKMGNGQYKHGNQRHKSHPNIAANNRKASTSKFLHLSFPNVICFFFFCSFVQHFVCFCYCCCRFLVVCFPIIKKIYAIHYLKQTMKKTLLIALFTKRFRLCYTQVQRRVCMKKMQPIHRAMECHAQRPAAISTKKPTHCFSH